MIMQSNLELAVLYCHFFSYTHARKIPLFLSLAFTHTHTHKPAISGLGAFMTTPHILVCISIVQAFCALLITLHGSVHPLLLSPLPLL